MRVGRHWKVVVALILLLIGLNARPGVAAPAPEAGAAPALQGTLVAMVSPSACPSGGCAAGQRLNMRFDFEPEGYDAAQAPNVKMCIYAPSGWGVNPTSVTVDATGELTGKPYQAAGDPGCPQDTAKPAGYDLIFERVAQLDANTLIDSLGFGFTLGPAASGNGRILARLFARDGAGVWATTPVQQVTSLPTITLTTAAERSFVANDAAACGTASPCYVNSGDDPENGNGIGTGLKDAIDAAPANATLYVLGSYTIKSNTVLVNKKLTITGPGNTNITYTGPGGCDKAMLRLTGEVALREILINDGICTNPNRNLIEVDSPAPVVIERTNMTSGADAITLFDNTGSLLVRFNDIHGNSGYALKGLEVTKQGPLTVVANNLDRNRAEQAIDCAVGAADPLAYRVANHNYWGSSSPSSTNSHCTIEASKRLGLAIALATDKPGVRAQLVNVGTAKTYSVELDSKIAYARTNTGNDFGLYLIDHGYATAGGPPFSFDRGIQSPSPCSNYWDVFLPENTTPAGALELYMKYDRTNACLATINSNQYCDQTSSVSKIPLYWYDPRNATGQWITTGSKLDSNTDGQVTSCDTTTNEVKVTIDSSGRPNLSTDLSYVPLMVGVPVINTFQPRASAQSITVNWSTNNEPDVVGFYVLRGQPNGAINPISDLIAHTGTALTGRSYSFVDSGRVNGVDYRYRLQVLRADGTSIYSSIVSIAANPATITPTATRAFTATPRPTNTRIPTLIFTRVPTRIPTRAATARPTSTVFPTALQLATRRPTLNLHTPGAAQTMTVWALTPQLALGTRTATLAGQGGTTGAEDYPGPDDGTPAAGGGTAVAVVGSGTPSPTVSPTPSFTPVRIPGDISAVGNAVSSGASPWLSLLLGMLAGLATTGSIGAAWYYLRLRKV